MFLPHDSEQRQVKQNTTNLSMHQGDSIGYAALYAIFFPLSRSAEKGVQLELVIEVGTITLSL